MNKYEKLISASEGKFYIDSKKKSIVCSGGGQASYNIPTEFFCYAKEHGIIKADDTFQYKRKDKDGKAYVLGDEYRLVLGSGALWITGAEYENKSNKLIGSVGYKNNKFQFFRAVYSSLNKEEYGWFVSLYDRNLQGNKVTIEIDEQLKTLTIDVEFCAMKDENKETIKNNEGNMLQNIEKIKGFNHNRIVFGAPGTGKSYELNDDSKAFGEAFERVTFHPNYAYGQFVGAYKPVPSKDADGNETITYEYVPGPFMRTLVESLKAKNKGEDTSYLLLIEEINRANVASVFGDVFQLLDRSNGESEYNIATTEDMKVYLSKALEVDKSEVKNIKIPSNMYIWATMNSADQGVFPMDTAFKRRWDFEYININNKEHEIEGYKVKLGSENEVSWNKLRKDINTILLKNCKVNEDKLMGPYFISKSKLVDSEECLKAIKNKVLMYIYDDAAGRQHRGKVFSGCDPVATYSEVCNDFEQIGEKIFGLDYTSNNDSVEN